MSLQQFSLKSLRPAALVTTGFLLVMGATAIASAATASTTVSSSISSVISLFTTSGTVNANVTPTAGGAQTIAGDTVTVSTSDSAGYTLNIGETTGSSSLVSDGDSIPASSASQSSSAALSTNTWGYRVDGIGSFGTGPTTSQSSTAISGTKFAAVPATNSPNTIKTTSGTASSDTTTVWYGVAANTSQPAGTYTNSVTYTAIAN